METILVIIFILIIGIIFKINDRKKKTIKEPYKVLCSPSGEIIKIKPKKWCWLWKNNKIEWNPYHNHYVINDRYLKFKI